MLRSIPVTLKLLVIAGGLTLVTGCAQNSKVTPPPSPPRAKDAVAATDAKDAKAREPEALRIPDRPKVSLENFGRHVLAQAAGGADSSVVFMAEAMMSDLYISGILGILATSRQRNEQGWQSLVAATSGAGNLVVDNVTMKDPTVIKGGIFRRPVLFSQQMVVDYHVGSSGHRLALDNLLWTKQGWRAVSFSK